LPICGPCENTQKENDEETTIKTSGQAYAVLAVLHLFGEIETEEVAKRLHCTPKNAYNHLYRQNELGRVAKISGVRPLRWKITNQGRRIVEKSNATSNG